MIYLILGGERSGKTKYAMDLALSLSDNPIYIATSRFYDDDFEERVERHKKERDDQWTNIEEQKEISKIDLTNKVAVIDCVTLWLNNFYADASGEVDLTLKLIKKEFDKINTQNNHLIFISNELGMGVHAENYSARKFVELQGWLNQYIAEKADSVTLMVAGIPLKVK